MKLLDKVELAILANGGLEWKKEWCQCDPDVGAVPCEYCATHRALVDTKQFLEELTSVILKRIEIEKGKV